MLNRRSFLRSAPAAGMALTVPAVAMAEKPVMTARERLDAAIAELKAATLEVWPTADDWTIKFEGSPSIPLFMAVYNTEWDKRVTPKVHFDDGSPLLADDVTGTTAFADWQRGQQS